MTQSRSNTKTRTLLLDADSLLYKYAFPFHDTIEWDSETTSEYTDASRAKDELDWFVQSVMEETNTSTAVLCLSSDFNFRYTVLPSYKHNRANLEKPFLYDVLKEHVEENYTVERWKWYEADDVIGVLATRHPHRYVIASMDKDLLQIPGIHYPWNKRRIIKVSPEEGQHFHLMQTLMGDPTDGYRGCPGVGPKKAAAFLEKHFQRDDKGVFLPGEPLDMQAVWEDIVALYHEKLNNKKKDGEEQEDGEKEALRQARVARICQCGQYREGNKPPVLWSPYPGYSAR